LEIEETEWLPSLRHVTFDAFNELEKFIIPESAMDKVDWDDASHRSFPQSLRYFRVTVIDKAHIFGCGEFSKGVCEDLLNMEIVEVVYEGAHVIAKLARLSWREA
jgi:hypothetical protein